MNNLLEIESLAKHYAGFSLHDISFSVPAGSVVGLIGSNGAGKTTTIKAVLGLIEPDGGKVSLFGIPQKYNDTKNASSLKQRIGVVFDACSFPADITVGNAENIMKYAYEQWDTSLFRLYLDLFKLDRTKKIKELSRGMSMKLSLACAFCHHPDLLILDEATAGLDPLARDEILDILREFMEDEHHGILLSSHITSDLEKIADYIVCIDEGQLIFNLERDTITDQAGIAHCRTSEFQEVLQSGFFPQKGLRFMEHPYEISVLTPDRLAFSKQFPHIAVDKAPIDSYMELVLKGATK